MKNIDILFNDSFGRTWLPYMSPAFCGLVLRTFWQGKKPKTSKLLPVILMSLELAKINEKFRGDYLDMNIRETDIYEEGRNFQEFA